MRTFRSVAVLALGMSLRFSQAQAEDWHGPLLDRDIGIEVPARFGVVPAFVDATPQSAIIEFLPPGETIESWSEMLTLTAYADGLGQPADQAVLGMANHLAQGYGAACPGAFAAEDLGAPAVAGSDAAFAVWLACGEIGGNGRSESVVVLIVAAGGKVFTAQWAERGPGSAAPPGFDMNRWLPRLEALLTLGL